MTPARTVPARRDGVRLLAVDPAAGRLRSLHVSDLPALLAPGDLLVVNDAATLPAALHGQTDDGQPVEIRLLDAGTDGVFRAVLFGPGDWRQPTEDRSPPPPLEPGARLRCGTLVACVTARSPLSPRLVELTFDARGAALWAALYREARPVQYSYLAHELPLWAVQTVYAARPWAVEMPSAGRPLSWEILLALRRRGVAWAAITHGAGLSSTGDAAIDGALPLTERFEISPAAVAAVRETKRSGGRVVAVGTTVVRALEGAVARWGVLRAGRGQTDLRLGPGSRLRVADGLLTGVHGPGESHFALLAAFAPVSLLDAATARATAEGYLAHEFGDAMLILPNLGPGGTRRMRPCPSIPEWRAARRRRREGLGGESEARRSATSISTTPAAPAPTARRPPLGIGGQSRRMRTRDSDRVVNRSHAFNVLPNAYWFYA